MEIGTATDRGKRRENNEDSLRVCADGLLIVCDGVGGSNSGEVASRMTADGTADYVAAHPLPAFQNVRAVEQYFSACFSEMNTRVREVAMEKPDNRGMATTIVGALLQGSTLYTMNIGDSRAYLVHDGALIQLTEDHSYVNSLLKAGIITEAEAKVHENRNMITRAIGAEEDTEADFYEHPAAPGDYVMLCTDGLYDEVDLARIPQLLASGISMQEAADRLVEEANAYGGYDNITVICGKITEDDIK